MSPAEPKEMERCPHGVRVNKQCDECEVDMLRKTLEQARAELECARKHEVFISQCLEDRDAEAVMMRERQEEWIATEKAKDLRIEALTKALRAGSILLSRLRPTMTLRDTEDWEELELTHNSMCAALAQAEEVLSK